MIAFSEKLLVAALEKLRPMNRVVFAASCAGRLAPMCLLFSRKFEVGDDSRIADALDFVWESAIKNEFIETTLREHLDYIMGLIPEEDDGWTPLHAYAEDGFASIAYSLRSLIENGSAQESAWAARRVYEALDQFVINKDNFDLGKPGVGELIISNPFIQQELARQARDILELDGVFTGESLSDFVRIAKIRCENEPAIADFVDIT